MIISLDTSAYSRYSRGDEKVEKVILRADKVFFPVISIGELYLGFKEGDRELQNLNILESFISASKVEIAKITDETATYYSLISFVLRKKGTPVPDNDAWIAASAIETKSTLITFDSHFLKIPSLKVWKELKS